MRSKSSVNVFLVSMILLLLVPFARRGFAWPFVPFDMYCETDMIHVEWLELKAVPSSGEPFLIPHYTLWRSQMPLDLMAALKGNKEHFPEKTPYLLDRLKRDYNAQATRQADKLQALLLQLEFPSSRSGAPRILKTELLGESN